MRIENTTESQKHYSANDETVIVPAMRNGVNGSAEVSKEFVEAAKRDNIIAADLKSGVARFVDSPKAAPAPAKSDEETAAANVAAALERQDKDKPKKT
jgi:hypothetical protein